MAEKITRLSIPKAMKDQIIASIPEQLIKEREGGGKKMLSYLSGSTVIDMLNDIFGYMWSWEVDREWITESTPYFNQYDKTGQDMYNGKKGSWVPQGPVAHVTGVLTVHILEPNTNQTIAIKKSGYGSKSILGKQNDQESIFKAAGTDALKKAASLIGIGLELYRDEDEQEYFDALNDDDPWTDEMIEKYSEESNYITSYMEENDLDADGMGELISEFSSGVYDSLDDVSPENIEAFVEFLKARAA